MSQANLVTVDYYRWLYNYSYWARDRVLAQVAKLDQDAYIAPRALDYGSIRGTLVHSLAREAVWLDRRQGNADSLIDEIDLPTFSTLIELWTREEARMRAFLNELTDPQLLLPISYESALTKNRYDIPLWQMMSPPSGPAARHTVRAGFSLY